MTPDARARRAADAMWADDAASRWLGMELVAVSEGAATLRLAVGAHHCNGHGTCHGGVIFALADSAFAFACNSRNQATVAQHAAVTFTAPGRAGDVLTAEAREVTLAGRSGVYDVRVTDQGGAVVAEFRGLSRAVPGQLFEEER
ncbi:hydroxyphenylacetyl-CoA thioesterase PaaI [Jannaschia ovalis]|uniref:Hydroxyphenylacetyl-CoA thioesterase PaaI n=1 Tax=Jannaschia ovalis TaxID=3038773 RepID=A0ABY8LJK0_9RHOB|nr:hydroxyphenylacetyl-CoA thioesterase PaaI [Jannaschia sp. GRR-S6-38]WGH80345.1 hydroxyphenylacetyl-CoA thioesterase PaaI [Jannaschia sp. GRR-S6-38]